MRLFHRKSEQFLCYFGTPNFSTKYRLFWSYCTSFYGTFCSVVSHLLDIPSCILSIACWFSDAVDMFFKLLSFYLFIIYALYL